ncbi:YjcZ family sporulation protein [Paenibacillus larvae]|nr:YjcZ family sporulation protein [Paenibacillus larvae]MDT2193877.1 YjcZ family sporulation protein [Paenibacillus larvae]
MSGPSIRKWSSCGGYGGFTSTSAILVLFILLVIISRSIWW